MQASSGTAPFSTQGQQRLKPPMQKKRPKVVFLICDAGGGHRSAANALNNALERKYPEQYETEIVDIGDLLGPVGKVLNDGFCQSYNLALRHGQYWLEPLIFSTLTTSRKVLEPLGIQYMRTFLEEKQPDLLVTLIHGAHDALVPAFKSYRQIPHITVVTDAVTIRKSWVDNSCHEIFVSTEEARQSCLDLGIHKEKLTLMGHPLDPRFAEPVDTAALQKRHQLNPESFTIMMMMGGTGGKNIYRFSRDLERAGLPIQILACCGSDQPLLKKMKRFAEYAKVPIKVFAYTDQIPELMSLSDLIITKPGPGTIMEALARDLPLIIDDTHYTMYQEKGNLDYVRNYNLGRVIHQRHELLPTVHRLLENPSTYAALKASVRQHKRPEASLEIAQRIHQHLTQFGA